MKKSEKFVFNLQQVRVETPCHENWDAMTGDEQRRFCTKCGHHVNYLSAMTTKQAQEALSADGRVCVRYNADKFGRPIVRDRRFIKSLAAAAVILAGVSAPGHAHAQQAKPKPVAAQQPTRTSGIVALPVSRQKSPPKAEIKVKRQILGDVAASMPPVQLKGKVKIDPSTKGKKTKILRAGSLGPHS